MNISDDSHGGPKTSYPPTSTTARWHKEQIDELKKLKADKFYVANIERRIDGMEEEMKKWSWWFRGSLITFVAILIGIGVTLNSKFSEVKSHVEKTDLKVDNLVTSVVDVTYAVKQNGKHASEQTAEQLEELKDVVERALEVRDGQRKRK